MPFMTGDMRIIGRKRLFKPSTGSTNSDLMRMAADNPALDEGLVLRAGEQTAGKGRQGREWIATPDGTLCFSILLKPDVAPALAASLPLVAGAATAEAMEAFCPKARIGIKWPNDIVANGRKLCGILCEMNADGDHVRHIVVGIGVNLSTASLPPALSDMAVSIEDISGNRPEAETVMDAILVSLDRLYREWLLHGFGHALPEVARRDVLRGGHVRIDAGGKLTDGTAMGVAADGSLLVQCADGALEHVYSGDAHLLGSQ